MQDYSRDEVVDMQVLKQADVVMLLNLFPHLVDEKTLRRNVLFYEERTIHDSSLSYCAHAQACAVIGGHDLAEYFFEKTPVCGSRWKPLRQHGWNSRGLSGRCLELPGLWIRRHSL